MPREHSDGCRPQAKLPQAISPKWTAYPVSQALAENTRVGVQSGIRVFLSQVQPQGLRKRGKEGPSKLYLQDINC